MSKYQELSVEDCRSLTRAKAKRLLVLTEMSGDGRDRIYARLEDRGELIEDLVKLYAAEVAILDAKPA